jgi:tRNA-dihydrouridine synthase
MIGRSAPSNPWIFRQIEQYCDFARVGPGLRPGQAEQSSAAYAVQDSEARISTEPAGLCPARPDQRSGPTQTAYDQPSEADRYQMIRTYFQMLIEEELPDAVGKMKQFASWFTHGVPGGAGLRKAIYESKSAPEILARVEEFFEARLCGVGAPAHEFPMGQPL